MYRCAKCTGKHTYAWEGRQCAGQPRQLAVTEPADPQQETVAAASARAERITAAAEERNKRLQFLATLLKDLPDGRYAASLNDDDKLSFVRISTIKKDKPGKRPVKGSRKIQTQHGGSLMIRAMFYVSGSVWIAPPPQGHDPIDQILAVILVDSRRCATRYGRKMKQCCRCGIKLTDERSRHYGIGPECEKFWPHIIEEVDQLEAEGRES